MRLVLVLAIRVASYWWVAALNPVHARVVNGAPLRVPSIFSSTNRPSNSGRIVEVPFVVTPSPPGLNQNVITTSQVPHIAVSSACSGTACDVADVCVNGAGGATAPVAATTPLQAASVAIKQAR